MVRIDHSTNKEITGPDSHSEKQASVHQQIEYQGVRRQILLGKVLSDVTQCNIFTRTRIHAFQI